MNHNENQNQNHNRKERCLTLVYLGAIARDLSQGTRDSQLIAQQADRIPESQIPINPVNAAKVFLSYVDGRSQPYRWMIG